MGNKASKKGEKIAKDRGIIKRRRTNRRRSYKRSFTVKIIPEQNQQWDESVTLQDPFSACLSNRREQIRPRVIENEGK